MTSSRPLLFDSRLLGGPIGSPGSGADGSSTEHPWEVFLSVNLVSSAVGGLFLGGEEAAALFWIPGGPVAQPEVSDNPI